MKTDRIISADHERVLAEKEEKIQDLEEELRTLNEQLEEKVIYVLNFRIPPH